MVALTFPSLPVPTAQALHRTEAAARSREAARHDAALVQRFNAGDQAAFTEIVTRYRARMHQIALRLLKNHADAEEIAQDTFVRAHRGLAKFRGESSLAAWLHRIALNLSRNRYWYFFRRRRHLAQSLDSTVRPDSTTTYADLIASPGPGPAREAASREFSAQVTAGMAGLNASQREILELRNVQEHSYRKISSLLGISLGTVKSRVARARETLRALVVPAYANPTAPRTRLLQPWFESSRPDGLLRTGS